MFYQCLTLDIFLTAAEELQRGFRLDGQLPVRPLHPALLFSALQSEPSERDPSLSVSSWKRSSPSLHLSLPLSGTPWCSSSSYLSSLQPPLCTFCTSSLSFILQIFFSLYVEPFVGQVNLLWKRHCHFKLFLLFSLLCKVHIKWSTLAVCSAFKS